jgi:hypothetical protein
MKSNKVATDLQAAAVGLDQQAYLFFHSETGVARPAGELHSGRSRRRGLPYGRLVKAAVDDVGAAPRLLTCANRKRRLHTQN